jgi:alanyl-tRNA synthetase
MAREVAQEEGFSIDEKTFQKLMAQQKERSKASWVGGSHIDKTVALEELKSKVGSTEFVGYHSLSADGKILAIFKDGKPIQEAHDGEKVEIFLNRSPFYGESGGQIGDQGSMTTSGSQVDVQDTQWPVENLTVHQGLVKKGAIRVGEEVFASVDPISRFATARHHTATHLLHYALRKVLGEHVKQSGSLVAPDRLRFDFAHFAKVSDSEIENIEFLVNERIVENLPLRTMIVPIEEAQKAGAIMFFGDKYGPVVRMIDIGGFSKELCGGTHVKATGEIGLFKIYSESSVASGIRRVEALSGLKAYETIRQLNQTLSELCSLLSTSPQEVLTRMERLLAEKRKLEKELESQQLSRAKSEISEILAKPMMIKDSPIYIASFDGLDTEALRRVLDDVKSRVTTGVIVLASKTIDRVFFVSLVTPDLVKKGFHAGKIVQELSKKVDGGGGGKPEMAQAGGKDPSKFSLALQSLPEILGKF